ncbi:MAG: hydrolase Nlp/P60 [Flavobacteriaceae bacterium]|nr:MAG: hydrolase Nlp/P60 [Flavobacteriaceae bacterium]
MCYGICNLSIVPLRLRPDDTSEMVTQVLFGECFTVLEKQEKWSAVTLQFDAYEGYIDTKQYLEISEKTYNQLSSEEKVYTGEVLSFITDAQHNLTTIPIGCSLPSFTNATFKMNSELYAYDGVTFSGKLPKEEIVNNAFLFLNSPYLWGGKTPFGIDCSGFTQMIYKLCGYYLHRDAKQQAIQGEVLSFIEESEPGDLAFFDNDEGIITHVGIIMKDHYIIHAHGKVRIDLLDHSGIYNLDTKKHTHKLRVIKKII